MAMDVYAQPRNTANAAGETFIKANPANVSEESILPRRGFRDGDGIMKTIHASISPDEYSSKFLYEDT